MGRVSLTPWQFVALTSPITHLFFFGGVGVGKTRTGAEFAIKNLRERPELTGFIGANNYNQLSQATLRMFFMLLDKYGYEYVIDSIPPTHWGEKRKFKSYNNMVSVRNPRTGKVTYIFTRVLSAPDPIRGIEFSWYWIDESRDTPENTHDVILGRMRESPWTKGIVTTTTNGEDWCFNRGVRMATGDGLYGSMHVPTIESVKIGILTKAYYQTMARSYSPLMAQQELEALHVNVKGGRAYYAADKRNRMIMAPWGQAYPDDMRPLIVGCDFNFQPAPCVWVVGQRGPAIHGPGGEFWADHIHWFGEIAMSEVSTPTMTSALLSRYPGFHYKIYGDASGERGTTSNAGENDYNQIASRLEEAGALFTIDVDQANPRVRDRIENANALFCNALGERRMTYDPVGCPLMDGDVRMVGWKPNVAAGGQGKLDDGGDVQRTHSTDGMGYAVFKEFPPGGRGRIIGGNISRVRSEMTTELMGVDPNLMRDLD